MLTHPVKFPFWEKTGGPGENPFTTFGRVYTNSSHMRSDVRYRARTHDLGTETSVVGGRRLDDGGSWCWVKSRQAYITVDAQRFLLHRYILWTTFFTVTTFHTWTNFFWNAEVSLGTHMTGWCTRIVSVRSSRAIFVWSTTFGTMSTNRTFVGSFVWATSRTVVCRLTFSTWSR